MIKKDNVKILPRSTKKTGPLVWSIFVTDSMTVGRTTSAPKSALLYELDMQIPQSGNLLYPSLVLPELKEVGRELILMY